MNICCGQWNDQKCYFGLHNDLQASKNDTVLGLCATSEELIPLFEQAGVYFVQTDCKGHPGYTGWLSAFEKAPLGWEYVTGRLPFRSKGYTTMVQWLCTNHSSPKKGLCL